MLAYRLKIHGTEPHPASDTQPLSQQDKNEQGPPPAIDPNQQSVDPNDIMSSNEQGHRPIRTSPVEPAITDSFDEDTSADNTINNNQLSQYLIQLVLP